VTFQPPPSDEGDARESVADVQPPPAERPVDQIAAIKAVSLRDWALLALGVAVLIFSCFDFYHFTSNFAGSKGFSAWHDIAGGGFFGWFGVILPLMATVVLALALFEPDAGFPLDPRLIALYGWGAGFICELLAIVLHPKFFDDTFSGGAHRHLGHGFSFWVVLGLTFLGTVVALMRAQQTRTALPGALKNLPTIGRS
jgi:hypothetical protein